MCKPHKDERAAKVASAANERRMHPDDGNLDEHDFDLLDCFCSDCCPRFDRTTDYLTPPLTQRLPL